MRLGNKAACALVMLAMSMLPVLAVAQSASTQWDGIYSAAQANRGQALFVQHCAVCHGDKLQGIDMAPALVGDEFVNNWNRLRFATLMDRVQMSMPKSAPASLPLVVYADVFAFILSKNGYPAGPNELSSKLSDLRSVTFVAKSPS